jgi:hypothetical protein
MSKNLANAMKPYCTVLAIGNDVVTRISIGSIKDLAQICLHFSTLEGTPQSATEISKSELGAGDLSYGDLSQLYRNIQASIVPALKLYHPGYCMQIYNEVRNSEFCQFRGY